MTKKSLNSSEIYGRSRHVHINQDISRLQEIAQRSGDRYYDEFPIMIRWRALCPQRVFNDKSIGSRRIEISETQS